MPKLVTKKDFVAATKAGPKTLMLCYEGGVVGEGGEM